jgi:hypothetical protein
MRGMAEGGMWVVIILDGGRTGHRDMIVRGVEV